MREVVVGGTYRHYKGNVYEVLAVAKHSETCEELVVYRSKEKGDVWVRPYAMFLETVTINGESVERFSLLKGK